MKPRTLVPDLMITSHRRFFQLSGGVIDEAEDALLLPSLLEADGRRLVDFHSQLGQTLVADEADAVIDAGGRTS
nr:hypothetical protein [Halomonas socia]